MEWEGSGGRLSERRSKGSRPSGESRRTNLIDLASILLLPTACCTRLKEILGLVQMLQECSEVRRYHDGVFQIQHNKRNGDDRRGDRPGVECECLPSTA